MDDQSIQEIEKRKKRSLKRYRKNLACIRRLEEKLVNLDERITAIKLPSLSGMPRGGTPVTLADLVSDKVDLEKRIEKLKAKSRNLKEAIYAEIDSLLTQRGHFCLGESFLPVFVLLGHCTSRVVFVLENVASVFRTPYRLHVTHLFLHTFLFF